MKATVKVPFVDKHTGAFYPVGRVLTLTEDRAKEIQEAGDFISVTAEPAPASKKKSTRSKKVK